MQISDAEATEHGVFNTPYKQWPRDPVSAIEKLILPHMKKYFTITDIEPEPDM